MKKIIQKVCVYLAAIGGALYCAAWIITGDAASSVKQIAMVIFVTGLLVNAATEVISLLKDKLSKKKKQNP